MAVRLEGTIKRYISDVGDEKPSIGMRMDGVTITAQDLPAGSSLMEVDKTNGSVRIYRWDGGSWMASFPVDEHLYALEAILSELKEFRQMVELAVSD